MNKFDARLELMRPKNRRINKASVNDEIMKCGAIMYNDNNHHARCVWEGFIRFFNVLEGCRSDFFLLPQCHTCVSLEMLLRLAGRSTSSSCGVASEYDRL